MTHPTVYKWTGRFDEEGPEGLFDRDREGRPRKTHEDVEREIEKLLESDPTEEGENASRPATPRIAEYLERELGIDVHPETVRDALKRLEYSWTRPRRQLRKGPDDEERLARLAERIGSVQPETTVLFADETYTEAFDRELSGHTIEFLKHVQSFIEDMGGLRDVSAAETIAGGEPDGRPVA